MINFYEMNLLLENIKRQLRQEAQKIASQILEIADKYKPQYYLRDKQYDLPYSSKYGVNVGHIIQEHPKLWLKPENQVGFGSKHLGTQSRHDFSSAYVISISIPNRTLPRILDSVPSDSAKGGYDHSKRILTNYFSNFIRRSPDNYEVLIHEITHYLYDVETKRKVFKNYVYPDNDKFNYKDYINHPAEYISNLNEFISSLQVNGIKDFKLSLDKMKETDWFPVLNDKLQRHAIKSLWAYTTETDSTE